MAKLKSETLFYTQPKRPEPINFACREIISWDELEYRFNRMPADELASHVKRRMVQQIAAALMEKLQPFMVVSVCAEGQAYQVEVLLSDRGTYENWLPSERRQGQKEGAEAMKQLIPYGVAPGEYYE